uniref:Putative salivary secreted protein n=1 Tax=Panstrongylus lignarius TaxID=156445 RepID=A0A224XNW6_9HEMI
MSLLKSAFFIIFLTGLWTIETTLATSCEGLSHNATYGQRKQGDGLIFRDHVVKSWKFLRYAATDVKYPLRGQIPRNITYIEIVDQYQNGHGGCSSIIKGGVGEDYVTIHIKSQFNRGFDFKIKMYGMKGKVEN